MSEATRSAALLHASNVHGADGHEAVLQAAKMFDAFLTGGTGEATNKPAAKPATKPAATAAKPATKPAAKRAPPAEDADDEAGEEAVVTKATRKAAAAVEEEEAGEEGEEVTTEQVETIIADLLGANLRKQAVALLGEYGAKSASGVKAGDRVAFYEQAQTLLIGS